MPKYNRLTGKDLNEAKSHIYGLAHNMCIDGKEQELLLNTLQEIEEESFLDGANGTQLIRNLLYPIIDILAYGNWPPRKM